LICCSRIEDLKEKRKKIGIYLDCLIQFEVFHNLVLMYGLNHLFVFLWRDFLLGFDLSLLELFQLLHELDSDWIGIL
jgi:hypothetical protein